MSEVGKSKRTYILSSTLLGMVSFLIGGIIACAVIVLFDNYILATIIAGGLGGLLLGLFLRLRKKLGRLTIAGIIGMPVGLMMSLLLVEGFGSLLPSVGRYFENSALPDVVAIILMGVIFGAVVGAIVYGLKSMWLFSLVCGVVSIPFGFLVAAMNAGCSIKIWLDNLLQVFGSVDLNFLVITISLGIGMGLSMGLYSRLRQNRDPR